MNHENEYISIDLLKLVEGMIHRIWVIITAMVLCGIIAFSWAAFLITPLYESSVMMYVNNSSFSVGATNFSITASEISAAKSLVETYLVILKSRMTLNEVIELGELDCSYDELYDMISAAPVNETEVFSITVTNPDPNEAEHIANTIARVLPNKIADIVEGSSVRIVDYAVVPSSKVSPSIRNYTFVGILLGLLASCGVIAIIEIMDDQIGSEEYLLNNFESIPLLAAIPDMLDEGGKKGSYYYKKYSYYSQNGGEG